jgi:hypothetical protein
MNTKIFSAKQTRKYLRHETGILQTMCHFQTKVVAGHLIVFKKGTETISKATDPAKEAYSVFEGTGLAEALKSKGVMRVFVGGLTTDYCVVNTIRDIIKLGYEAVLLADAIRGLNVEPGDVDRAIELMLKIGAKQVTLADFPEPDTLPNNTDTEEAITDKPLSANELKKKARMRPKGAYKRVRREHG